MGLTGLSPQSENEGKLLDRVTELIGYCSDLDGSSLIFYRTECLRILEIVRIVRADQEIHLFSKYWNEEDFLAFTFKQESWMWIHSSRDSEVFVKKHNQVFFRSTQSLKKPTELS